MVWLLGTGEISVYRAAAPEASLRITLMPTRGELVCVLVQDRGIDAEEDPLPSRLFAAPYRAEGLVEVARVRQLVTDLQALLAARFAPADLTDTDLVLRVSLPLADGLKTYDLRETDDSISLGMVLGLIQDFAMQVVVMPETRMERGKGGAPPARRSRLPWARLLAIVLLIGIGGYLVGDFFQRALGALGCAP